MGIGPEARRAASGRIVVVAGLFVTLGAATTILGAGPIILSSEPGARQIGVASVALGCLLIVAAACLGLRRGPARLLGVVGGMAATVIGAFVIIAGAMSADTCHSGAGGTACALTIGGIVMAGIGVVVGGVASAIVVNQAPREALRRRLRPPRQR